VAELLRLDDGLRDLIVGRAPLSQIKQAARERGMVSLREAAAGLVRAGRSSFEEWDRVTLED
jgi:general secretion pathway protein E